MHANPTSEQIATGQNELDGAIAVLEKVAPEAPALLIEHLKGAKMYLLGSMTEEYFAELEMARQTAEGLPDKHLRRSTSKTIDHLKDELARSDAGRQTEMLGHAPVHHRLPHHAPEGMGRLWNFFGTAPVKLGTFYPTSFVAAVFPSYKAAENALTALRVAGLEEDDAIAARGEEMSTFFEDLRERSGAWGQLMSALSRMFGTEQLFTDVDVDLARTGKGFLLVYSPDEEEAKMILDTVKPFAPVFMQRYLPGAVEGMIKPPSVTGPER